VGDGVQTGLHCCGSDTECSWGALHWPPLVVLVGTDRVLVLVPPHTLLLHGPHGFHGLAQHAVCFGRWHLHSSCVGLMHLCSVRVQIWFLLTGSFGHGSVSVHPGCAIGLRDRCLTP
jgi:hypothetical protein